MKAQAVTHEAVLASQGQRTLRLVQQQRVVVLMLHDGSELDYSGLTSLHKDLGRIGDGFGKGYECLNSLAVLAKDRTVLGLVSQLPHVRPRVPKDETRVQRRDRADRESLLWLKAVDAVTEATRRCRRSLEMAGPPEGLLEVDVVDRGGDPFEFMDYEDFLGRGYVLRSKHNRCIEVGHEGEGREEKLHDYLRTLPAQGRRASSVPERDGRPARETTAAAAWKAVEWFLLTNLPVETLEQAWEKVDWYCRRWIIEEFHKARKTGCSIEALQFEQVERLRPMIALLSVAATTLLGLRDLSRDPTLGDLPATEGVDEEQEEVLSGWRYGQRRALTVRAFFQALARMGGHQGRRGDGEPGRLVLWRGWADLQRMVAGARAARSPKAAPPDAA
jgi:Transposase Tn5 dimerisation domain